MQKNFLTLIKSGFLNSQLFRQKNCQVIKKILYNNFKKLYSLANNNLNFLKLLSKNQITMKINNYNNNKLLIKNKYNLINKINNNNFLENNNL